MNRAKGESGFTLTELATVIVILGIIAVLTVPRFNRTATDTAWFGDQVKAAVRYAQKQAIAQRRAVYVIVAANASLSLCYDNPCTQPLTRLAGASKEFSQYQPDPNTFLKVPPNVSLSSAPAAFSFNRLGQPSSAATLTVGGTNITVTAETGYVL